MESFLNIAFALVGSENLRRAKGERAARRVPILRGKHIHKHCLHAC